MSHFKKCIYSTFRLFHNHEVREIRNKFIRRIFLCVEQIAKYAKLFNAFFYIRVVIEPQVRTINNQNKQTW